mmetsp:Transcript_24634/g.47912  ORF Transcript_24634/g.47912 Transcript_24634/m.47912 type:complete len:88 (-) Transcript_24634:76-339(-)
MRPKHQEAMNVTSDSSATSDYQTRDVTHLRLIWSQREREIQRRFNAICTPLSTTMTSSASLPLFISLSLSLSLRQSDIIRICFGCSV